MYNNLVILTSLSLRVTPLAGCVFLFPKSSPSTSLPFRLPLRENVIFVFLF